MRTGQERCLNIQLSIKYCIFTYFIENLCNSQCTKYVGFFIKLFKLNTIVIKIISSNTFTQENTHFV